MTINNIKSDVLMYKAQLDRADTMRNESATRGKETQASQPTGDRVTVSSAALLRTSAYQAAQSAPDVRQSRVDELKSRVNDGTYTVNSRDVAQKLLQSEVELLTR